jgi:transcriptional regulator of acetoin/glycerol metabolism
MITDSDHLHHPAWVPSLLSGQTTSPHRLTSSDDIRPVDRPIGISDAWHDLVKRSSQVAATEAPTRPQGESGTGKEVIARFIHRLSPASAFGGHTNNIQKGTQNDDRAFCSRAHQLH